MPVRRLDCDPAGGNSGAGECGETMKARTKKFDAVVESRKSKEAVARETEGMTAKRTIAYFNRAVVRRRFEAALRQAEQADKATGKRRKKRPEDGARP
jgi:hypothetical protein